MLVFSHEFLVSEQTCSTDHQIDRSKWQTLLALDLWDVLIEIWRSLPKHQPTQQQRNCSRSDKSKPKQYGNQNVDQLSHVDLVHFWREWSGNQNDHLRAEVQRWDTCQEPTHRVVLEWLFDKIDLNLKIRIKYVEIKNQLADTCSHFLLSNTKQSAMSRRARESASKKARQWQNRDQWIWCQETSWVRRSSARLDPTSALMSKTSTRRSTAPPKTRILRTNTTQQSPPQRVLIYLHIPELEAPVSKVHEIGSKRNRLWKQLADYESVDIRNSIKETCAPSTEKRLFPLLWGLMNWKRREIDIISCAIVERQDKSPQNPWTESWLIWPSEERNQLIENSTKLKQTWKNPDMALDEIIQEFESLTISAATCESDMRNSYSLIVLKCLVLSRICGPWLLWSRFMGCGDRNFTFIKQHPKKTTNPATAQITIATLSCGKYTRHYRWSLFQEILLVTLMIQNQPQTEILYFRMSHICSQKLDGQEANITASRLYGIRN